MSHLFLASESQLPLMIAPSSIECLVINTLARQLEIKVTQISPHTRFDELKMDSIDIAELIFQLEDCLLIALPLADGVQVQTIQDAINLINSRRHSK